MNYSDVMILAREVKKDLVGWRRSLHKIPETGLGLPLTRSYIREELSSLGPRCLVTDLEGGVLAEIGSEGRESGTGPDFFLRFDMDALPLAEETGLDFSSRHPGLMHACGHDGNAAVGLGLAFILARNPRLLRGRVRIAFQAGEEILQGASLLVRDLFAGPGQSVARPADASYSEIALSMHLDPLVPQGRISIKDGQLNAIVDNFQIAVTGKAGHGGYPHLCADPLVAAAALVMAAQTIISRNLPPGQSAVITFGKIAGGSAPNIIPQEVILEGTLRSGESCSADIARRRLAEISDGIGRGYGVCVDTVIEEKCPAVVCDSRLAHWAGDILRSDLGPDKIISPGGILMGGDDFAYICRVMPALMLRFGIRHEEKEHVYPLHSNRFNFDEEVLVFALGVFLRLISAGV
ncbi:MAG: M20 metallopeptidase family protein [Desulfocucumaceae bacterium]